MHNGEFNDKIACVVGGTSGIGQAVAEALSALGAKVSVTGATKEEAERFAAQTTAAIEDTSVLNVMEADAVARYCRRHDKLDVLVNTVGIGFAHKELEETYMVDCINVNLVGVGRVCVAMYPALKTAGGSIVNIASMTSFFGSVSNPAYSAAKGGVVQLTKSLACLWGKDGIRVNAVAPGYIRTRMTERKYQDAEEATKILGRTPLGRWGEPADVVGPILFLNSSAARFVTGAVLPVDGGFLVA